MKRENTSDWSGGNRIISSGEKQKATLTFIINPTVSMKTKVNSNKKNFFLKANALLIIYKAEPQKILWIKHKYTFYFIFIFILFAKKQKETLFSHIKKGPKSCQQKQDILQLVFIYFSFTLEIFLRN